MATKLYDICVSVGTFIGRDGQPKNQYRNVGAMMQGDNGNFLLLDRTFNPAGVPHDPGKGNSILLSLFEPRQDGASSGGSRSAEAPAKQAPGAKRPGDDFTDDIPF